MAAQNTNITASSAAPTLLTDGPVAACRVSSLTGYVGYLQATADTTPPASRAGAVPLMPNGTLAADLTLAELFPGVGDGDLYLWVFVDVGGDFSVSHA